MSGLSVKIANWQIAFTTVPRGNEGSAFFRLSDGEQIEVHWRKDGHGIWIELPHGTYGFDICREFSDEGSSQYRISRRGGSEFCTGATVLRAGEESLNSVGGHKKKGTRLRSQMPGKIVKVLVKEGDLVEKDQSLMVIEAMKMENQIRAPGSGTVKKISVSQGQTVESGADLLFLE